MAKNENRTFNTILNTDKLKHNVPKKIKAYSETFKPLTIQNQISNSEKLSLLVIIPCSLSYLSSKSAVFLVILIVLIVGVHFALQSEPKLLCPNTFNRKNSNNLSSNYYHSIKNFNIYFAKAKVGCYFGKNK